MSRGCLSVGSASRQIPVFGEDGVRRLAEAAVPVLGCGGVGSSYAEALARAGVGRLAVVDADALAENAAAFFDGCRFARFPARPAA